MWGCRAGWAVTPGRRSASDMWKTRRKRVSSIGRWWCRRSSARILACRRSRRGEVDCQRAGASTKSRPPHTHLPPIHVNPTPFSPDLTAF
ncbi:hypothetical protein CBM2606_A10065 [Cupriavidus taiwanensis]|nr:hypothetical protein CBM2606_A10065 [Cupriavidus taiwanensis]